MDMSEHTFETSGRVAERAPGAAPGYQELLDEFRTHTTEWVQARRGELVGEQRRLHVEELAAVCVLDERRVDREPEPGLTHRGLRDELEVARAPGWAPADLQRQARAAKVVTAEDAAARREARELRWWDDPARGGVSWRGFLPDVDGVLAKRVFEEMVGRMRPPQGAAWDTLAHRGADAFVDLCQNYADVTPTRRHRPLVVMHVTGASAEVDGIPIAPETLEQIRSEARVVEQRDDAPVVDYGAGRFAVPAELARIVEHRDPHCRYPGCQRTWRLQHHHLTPVSWDGHTTRKTVVRLCPEHHTRMRPHGNQRLVGDRDQPDGLQLINIGIKARAGPAP